MIALAVPEIHCTRGFCDKEEEEESGILVVRIFVPTMREAALSKTVEKRTQFCKTFLAS